MVVKELLNPDSIVVVGASNDPRKPGGKVLKNLMDGGYDGKILAVNPKEDEVQGIACAKSPGEIDHADLAIIAIASKYILQTVETLAREKGVKAFIVLSAGFSEIGPEGKELEDRVVEVIDSVGGSLIGPNCIGMLTPRYKGVFAGPLPKLDPAGCDFVTGSGATAVFILESAIPMGINFASLYSVGNSAQIGVEEVIKYWDENFDAETSPRVKMIYIEKIDKPMMLLKHARSLIRKGCHICAIKAGTTGAGSRAVSSHTGALAGSDQAVDALFRKAGIVRCHSREELVYQAGVFQHKQLQGKNIAVVTHAGGPGVMLTDTLAKNDMEVPHIEGPAADELLGKLFHGSSVANPIDFIATGTAEQLGEILDYIDNKFENIDGSAVIFGTTGLFDVTPVYDMLDQKMKTCKKPIYPILPSGVQAKEATEHFLSLGRINFPDECNLGRALANAYHAPRPAQDMSVPRIDIAAIRQIIGKSENGYLAPDAVQELLDAAGIARVDESVATEKGKAADICAKMGYPVVMKVVGPVHKSDAGGVKLGIRDRESALAAFDELMRIEGAEAVLIQKMISGREIFIGAKREPGFGHMVLCGLGGIFVEVLKDVSFGLAPLSQEEAADMIRSLRSYDLIRGVRGQQGVNEYDFAGAIVRVAALTLAAPEIAEMDINPLMGAPDGVTAVDARIRIEK
ncbi:MAG: acetate--CoA ligase family protein [Candidatus Kapaibacterium sp.]